MADDQMNGVGRRGRRVAVVTGASAGLGLELAGLLAADGYDLALVNRSRAGSEAVLARVRAAGRPGAAAEVFEADLADPAAVRAAAAQVTAAHPAIDALFNNAGVSLGELAYNAGGVELHLQVNALAPYALTRLLRGPLAATRGVVVNVSSGVISQTGRLRVDDLRRPPAMAKLFGPYAQSKLALTALTVGLAPDYARDGVRLRSVDPGGNRTKMTAGDGMPWWLMPVRHLLFTGPAKGARLIHRAATDPALGDQTGIHLVGGRVRTPPADAADPAVRDRLLALCRDLTGLE